MNYVKRLQELGCKAPTKKVDNDIQAIEAGIGVALPKSYGDFLATCGGWWGDILCRCQEPTPFGADHGISSFHNALDIRNLLDSAIAPRNMITIGAGHFAKYTCLAVAGIDHGSVYALDGESRAYWSDEEFYRRFNAMDVDIGQYLKLRREEMLPEKPAGYACLYLLACDFDDFLSKCRSAFEI